MWESKLLPKDVENVKNGWYSPVYYYMYTGDGNEMVAVPRKTRPTNQPTNVEDEDDRIIALD